MSVGYQYEDCHCHPWCSDPSRDEFIRAAEDGRKGRLPTLEEAIAAITQRGNDMATKAEIQAADYRAQATSERTEGVTQRRPVDAVGGRNVTGSRTERVTLEITRPVFANYPTSAVHFQWQHLLRNIVKGERESVRVVDTHAEEVAQSVAWEGARDAYRGRIARLTDERDAAIRELDTLQAQRITQALTADRFAAAVQEADTLRARVAELESSAKLAPTATADGGSNHAAPAASGAAGPEPMAWGVMLRGKIDRHAGADALFIDKADADGWCGAASLHGTAAVVALYTAPQLAKGWLTPEVVLPESWREAGGEVMSAEEVRAALAAAGVTVKEVGCE